MPKPLAILLLLLPSLIVEGQSIRLTKHQAHTALYLSAEHLYNFNLYERHRFELGFAWVVPNESCPSAKYFLGQWTFRGYGAYSTGDKDFKFGANAQLRLPTAANIRIRLRAFKDLERAASRRLTPYRMLSPSFNTGYATSRYVGTIGAELALTASPSKAFSYSAAFRQSWEDYRFDSLLLLYPTLCSWQQTSARTFSEVSSRLSWSGDLIADLRAGRMADDTSHRYYFRSLLQYSTPSSHLGLSFFAQLGFSTQSAPYSRMFDLSGTSNTIYFFRNTFLTIAPNSFTSNIFSHLCVSYTTPLPLWQLSWSSPRPFFQLNAMWGYLFDQDHTGRRYWDGLPLQAPNLGLAEAATGFCGLIHWGLIDLGFGVAYRLCPTSASYFSNDPTHNFAFAVVADLVLDKYNK